LAHTHEPANRPDTAAPIQRTLERAAATLAHLGTGYGPRPEGWHLAAELFTDPAALATLLDEVRGLYEMDDRQVGASFLVMGYFWYLMGGAIACYLLERRVPDLDPATIAFDPRRGVLFASRRCWALAGDPDARHPEVDLVTDLTALRARLVEQLEQCHAAPLFTTLRSIAPLGVNAMRANYLDRYVSVVLWLAEQLGDLDLARREAPALLALTGPKTRSGIIEIEHAGRSQLFLRRAGCCLNYRLPGREKCDTCPLSPEAQRTALLRAYLAMH